MSAADAHLQRISDHVSAYLQIVRSQLLATVPKAVVHCTVVPAKETLLSELQEEVAGAAGALFYSYHGVACVGLHLVCLMTISFRDLHRPVSAVNFVRQYLCHASSAVPSAWSGCPAQHANWKLFTLPLFPCSQARRRLSCGGC